MSIASTQVPKAKRERKGGIAGAQPKITLDQAEAMVFGELEGKTQKEIAASTGICQPSISRYLGVSLDPDFPSMADPDWLDKATTQIKHFMAIATWKATRKLAETIDQVTPDRLPLAAAITIDKFSLLNGNPTSLAVVQHHTINHNQLHDRMKQAREASTATDFRP